MEQSSNVLKFGNWESQQDVPYTAYFEKARKSRTGDKLKPNDTLYNPNYTPPVQAPPYLKEVTSKDLDPTGSRYEHHRGREAGKLSRFDDSPLHHNTIGRKTAGALPQQIHVGARSGSSEPKLEATMGTDASRRKYELNLSRQGVELRRPNDSSSCHETLGHRASVDLNFSHNGGVHSSDKRPINQMTGPNHRIDHSPLHPRYQAMVVRKSSGASSPSWEKRVSSEGRHGLSPSNQRSHLASVMQDSRKPEDSAPAVPKFGDWDERNPSSADGFTCVFNKIREEKQTVEGTVAVPVPVPAMVTEPSNPTAQKPQGKHHAKKCCCFFPWMNGKHMKGE